MKLNKSNNTTNGWVKTNMNIETLLNEFMHQVSSNQFEIYNEFSLQHELGIFLRENLCKYKVQFERNADYFGIDKTETVKHEIDVVVFSDDKSEKYAIELKYPRAGQYPEQMFAFIKDINFTEQLKEHGFNNTYCLTLVDNSSFYSCDGKRSDGIYSYFRCGNTIHGDVEKPTGKNKYTLTINGSYNVDWKSLNDGEKKFYIIKI